MVPSLRILDRREFGLYESRHGHGYVLIRGFPWRPEDEVGTVGPVLDLLFESVSRVSCWRDFSPLLLRYAVPSERESIQLRVGELRSRQRIYLLEPDTIESYVIASRLTVAEFDVGGGAISPLVSDDRNYVARNPPVSGRHAF